MTWVWESELIPLYGLNEWKDVLHLKKSWVSHDGRADHTYKISAAWITRLGKRKWALSFADTNEAQTFSTLKEAKAYALATVILGA